MKRLLAMVGTMLVLAATPTAHAEPRPQPVVGWIRHNAIPLDTADPELPVGDMAALRRSIGEAEIVGLGESTHGAREEITLKHRTLRFLVERLGFRSIAWEEDWTTGLQVNEYIRTGTGDLDALVAQMSPQWQSREVADVLRWLRSYNARHADKVQFVGVEYYFTKPVAYDAVERYVANTAPERLPDLRRHLQAIRPSNNNMWDHIDWYSNVVDQQTYVDHARRVHALVAALPHRPDDRAHALVLHHARQVRSFYFHFSQPSGDSLVYRDAQAARNLRWWRSHSGDDKIVYWAASLHTAKAPRQQIVLPSDTDMRFPSAGSYLARWYGYRYLSIGFTFAHGTVRLGPEQTALIAPPAPDWLERPLGEVRLAQFALDLRTPAPPPARNWLHSPIRTRGLPDQPGSYIIGGTLAQWFDVVVHRQQVTPVDPIPIG